MFRITTKERDYLLKHGCEYHKDLHATGSHHNNHVYATENNKVLTLLKQLNEKNK